MSLQTLARNTLIGLIVLAFVYYIFYNWLDIPLMYFIYTGSMNTPLMPISHFLSDVFQPECWLLAGAISVGYAFLQHRKPKPNPHTEAFMRFGLTIIATGVVVTALKILIGRYRPDMLLTDNVYGFHFISFSHDANSAPSGHATMAFCGFYTIARLLKKSWLTPLLLLCAVMISLAKLVLADHYISDILFGGYLGIICSIWMEVFLNYAQTRWCPRNKIKSE